MKTEAIVAASIDFDSDPAAPRAPAFDDLYHPREGAIEQARAVFLAGNGLPERWRGRERFTIVETGFGLGSNFLSTWAAWRDDPQRCARLHVVALEKHPPTRADLERAHAHSPLRELARALANEWPPLTPNLHAFSFEGARVQLLLGFGDAATLARELVAGADAFYLDGFAPARNPAMWSPELLTRLARLAAPGATAATWSAARAVRDGLAQAGFAVTAAPGPGRKRDITLARFAPRFTPPRPPGRALPAVAPGHAIVVGAGLAGAAAVRALARQGVSCTVFERAPQPATQASGNPAGLFHGTVAADDGPHARLHRAASRHAAQWVREALAHGVAGSVAGLLRLDESGGIDAMRALVAAQRLDSAYVQALDAAMASALAGLALHHPAWFYAEGGWVDPAALVRDALAAPGVTWRGAAEVHAIEQVGQGWRVLDAQQRELAAAPLLVLANANDSLRLAGLPAAWAARVRGQLSWIDTRRCGLDNVRWPALPIASAGHVLALPDGRLLMGATQQAADDDAHLRDADHDANLQTARRLIGDGVAPLRASEMGGRVGWRMVTRDRLPLAGPVPDATAPLPARRDAPRLVPRRDGLFFVAGLGSRGLTTAALCGELIAAQATGAPWPLEADLCDAIDPARFTLRPPG